MKPAKIEAFVPARRVHIGIDPGETTGLAILAGRRFMVLEDTTFWDAYWTVIWNYPPHLVARIDVEIATTTHTWHLKRMKKPTLAKAAKVGQDVGSAREKGVLLADGFEAAGYKVRRQEPLGVGKDKRTFRMITGLTDNYSEHVRDAAVLAFTAAN